MDISRRQLLQAAGAGAALSTVPAGVLTAGSAVGTGNGLFAVVSQHATWGVYETLDMARHEAGLIRDAGVVSSNAVRCSPELARQFQLGKLGRFIEVNGWALTPEEIEAHGGDYLHDAKHTSSARRQVLEHHLGQLQGWYEAHESRSSRSHRNGGGTRCEIVEVSNRHPAQLEHDARMRDDIVYRLAVDGSGQRQDVATLMGPTNACWVAVAKRKRWIFGAGHTQMAALEMATVAGQYLEDEWLAVPASQTLAHAVVANGYEIPPFWRVDHGMLRHDVEFDT